MFKPRFGWVSALCWCCITIAVSALLSVSYTPTHAAGLPPIAVADQYMTDANEPLVVTLPGLLTNDHHPDGSAFWVSAYIPARSGVLSGFYADGRFTYTPNLNFVGVDVFYYQLEDVTDTTSPAFATVSILVGVKVGDDVLSNGSFEAPDLTNLKTPEDWTVQDITADLRVCNAPAVMMSQDADCAFRFTGSKSEKAQIKQVINPTLIESLGAGDTLALTLYARTKDTDRRTQITLKITYTDTSLGNNGVSNHILKLPRGTTLWWFYSTQPITLEGAVSEVMVKVKHQGHDKTGKVWIDNIRLVDDGHVALAAPAPLDFAAATMPRAALPAWTSTTLVQPVSLDAALHNENRQGTRSGRLLTLPSAPKQ